MNSSQWKISDISGGKKGDRCLIGAIPVKVNRGEESEYNGKQWCYIFFWGSGRNKVNIKNILGLGRSERIVPFWSSPWMRGTEPTQIRGQFLLVCHLISSANIVIVNALLSLWPFFSYHTFFKFYVLNSVKYSSSQEWRSLCSSKKFSQSRNSQGLALSSLYHDFLQRMTSICSILLYFNMLIRKVSMGATHPGNRQWLACLLEGHW